MRRGAGLLALVLVAAACDLTDPVEPPPVAELAEPAPVPTDGATATLRWALRADPGSLDPRDVGTDEERVVVGALFDSLTSLDRDGRAVPALATTWDVDATGTRWTFRLDPAARWHDGSPVVADDVVRAWRRVLAGGRAPLAGLLQGIRGAGAAEAGGGLAGAVAVDTTTLEVVLVAPEPDLPRIVAHPGLAPVPPLAEADPAAFSEAPVGNGPWMLAEAWAHNQFLRLTAAEDHPRPGLVDEVVFRVYAGDADGTLRYADLGEGTIQVAEVPPGLRDAARDEHGVAERGGAGVHDGATAAVSVLLLDAATPPLHDARVRRAVSLLVDRQRLATLSADERLPATAIAPPTIPGALAGACDACRHDPAEASGLLRRAARDMDGDPPPITIVTSPDELHVELADELAGALSRAGFETVVEQPGPASYLDRSAELTGAVVRLGWSAPTTSLGDWVRGLLAPGSVAGGLLAPDEKLEDLVAAAAASPLANVSRLRHRTALHHAQDTSVVVPVLHYRDTLLVGDDIRGLHRQPTGDVELTTVQLVGVEG